MLPSAPRLEWNKRGFQTVPPAKVHSPVGTRHAARFMRLDTSLFALLLVGLNLPLFWGNRIENLGFFPTEFMQGEWWRLIAYAMVHVSWYHFLLDAAAFLILFESLREARWGRRLAYVCAAAIGSSMTAWCASPTIFEHGLFGLSGVAHGIMAIMAVEMMNDSKQGIRMLGWASFLMLIGKCLFEAVTGAALFRSLHFGLLGLPIVVCHAGGVLGALGAWMVLGQAERLRRA